MLNAESLAHEGGTTGSSGRHFLKASCCRQWEMKPNLPLISLSVTSDFVNMWMLEEKW